MKKSPAVFEFRRGLKRRIENWLIRMQLFPDLRKYRQNWKHVISIPKLGGRYIGYITIDSKYLLWKDPYSYDFFILPALGSEHPSFDELVFYANCLAYDHDTPTLLSPRYGRRTVEPLKAYSRKKSGLSSYRDDQLAVLEFLGGLKWGGTQYVLFRWADFEQRVDLKYSTQYLPAAEELSLYSLALRQFDPLSEFLHYYRIMERADKGNGKNWIADNLDRIKTFDFGFLEFEEGLYLGNPKTKRRVNLFQRYRRKAQKRLQKLSGVTIQDYFYHVNRCGIAHGKKDLRHYDFSTTVADIWQDVYIIKLLSRIAIQDKMGQGNLVHKMNLS